MLACGHLEHGGGILTKVETLSRMNLSPYCLLEISVRDLPILIPVESFEDLVESLISHVYSPVVKVEF